MNGSAPQDMPPPLPVALVDPSLGLVCALKCDYLRRRVRHLKVSFRHSYRAKGEETAKSCKC
jgi:hypothetical protein